MASQLIRALHGATEELVLTIMNSPFVPFIAIVIAVISLQFGAACAKQLFPQAGAIGITLLRLSLASAMLMLAWRPLKKRISLDQFKAVVPYGLSIGLMNLCFYLAIERIPLGLAVALEFSGPLTLAFISSRKKTDFLWAMLAALGIVLISPVTDTSGVDMIGVCFALVAACFWALYIVTGARVARILHEGHAAAWGVTIGAMVVLPIALVTNSHANLSLTILPQALLVALFSSAIPFSLELFALKRLSKLSFGILMSMEPAMAAVMGLFILNERLSVTEIAAILFIIIASVGTTFSRVQKDKPSFAS